MLSPSDNRFITHEIFPTILKRGAYVFSSVCGVGNMLDGSCSSYRSAKAEGKRFPGVTIEHRLRLFKTLTKDDARPSTKEIVGYTHDDDISAEGVPTRPIGEAHVVDLDYFPKKNLEKRYPSIIEWANGSKYTAYSIKAIQNWHDTDEIRALFPPHLYDLKIIRYGWNYGYNVLEDHLDVSHMRQAFIIARLK